MDKKELIHYIENSFLKELLEKEFITDISYNGKDIYYVSNLLGRKKYERSITNQEVKDFLRQLSNISEKAFSYTSPILDVNIGKYRINAMNGAVARVGLDESVTFSIRIAQEKRMINHDEKFMSKELEDLFDVLLSNHISLIISGVTGVGKTEFQKYLISRLKENERILIIDQTIELANLDINNNLDITLWEANNAASMSTLVKNGLRNNPDWMIISEARGEEMNDVINSSMTGIPLITTIHSFDAKSGASRMARMALINKTNVTYEDILENINYHFRIYIHLSKKDDKGKIKRYIDSIIQSDVDGTQHQIYLDNGKKKTYQKLSKEFISLLNLDNYGSGFKKFIYE